MVLFVFLDGYSRTCRRRLRRRYLPHAICTNKNIYDTKTGLQEKLRVKLFVLSDVDVGDIRDGFQLLI